MANSAMAKMPLSMMRTRMMTISKKYDICSDHLTHGS
jgi:hypothetical protein